MMSSPDSTSIMLSPISPSPPSGMRRTAGSAGASIWSGSGRYAVLTAAHPGYHRRLHRPKKGSEPSATASGGSARHELHERSVRQAGELLERQDLGADISIQP